jgi:hypothetical protein
VFALRIFSVVLACGLLAACSATAPMPYVPISLTLSDETEPLPTDYLVAVRDFAGPNLSGVTVSEPRRLNSWSIFDAAQWYVCVRDAAGRPTVFAISGSKVVGKIVRPAPVFCSGAQYSPLQ